MSSRLHVRPVNFGGNTKLKKLCVCEYKQYFQFRQTYLGQGQLSK